MYIMFRCFQEMENISSEIHCSEIPACRVEEIRMPPRRSRRTAGQDPEQPEVEKDLGTLLGDDDNAGKAVAKDFEVEAENGAMQMGAYLDLTSLGTEEKNEKEVVVAPVVCEGDLGKKNVWDTEASCSGQVTQEIGGKSEETTLTSGCSIRFGDTVGESSLSGGRENNLQILKRDSSSNRHLNAASSEDEYYSGDEEVNISE